MVKKKEEKPKKKETAAKKPRKAKKKKTTKAVVARGKRKECVARATIKEGKGIVRLNKMNVDAIPNNYVKEIITEPLHYIGAEATQVDISVNVRGGGSMGQAQAARVAIANALVKYFEDKKLREKFIAIDRSLVIEDIRRVEAKKFRGPKARARYQKSYR
ncbi:30S ribosomal protein S9 [Candidatus Micrarchaeota archaeon]|nr:30S ribosomal protein S9 [Candidatus Micrarchaeota archaeon]